MYFEMRTYQVKVGAVQAYLQLYRDIGYEVQREYLGDPVGFFYTEVGGLNQIIHIWKYGSLDDRAERRARLFSDPRWTTFLEKSWPLVVSQRSELLRQFELAPAATKETLGE